MPALGGHLCVEWREFSMRGPKIGIGQVPDPAG